MKRKSKGGPVPAACPPGYRSDANIMNRLNALFDITPEDIKSDWMDLMVKRLFSELNRQLCQVESEKKENLTAADRAENARILASLQKTLKELARMEAERDGHRKRANVAKDADARKALEHKLDGIAALKSQNANAGGDQR